MSNEMSNELPPLTWPAGGAELHIGLLGIGKAMAKERSREIGDAWNQLADLLHLLSKARAAEPQPVQEPVIALENIRKAVEALRDSAIERYAASTSSGYKLHDLYRMELDAIIAMQDASAPFSPQPGDLVRYEDGSTALALHGEPHAGGWHGRQCMGGYRFYTKVYRPTHADRVMWVECAIKWRKVGLSQALMEAGLSNTNNERAEGSAR